MSKNRTIIKARSHIMYTVKVQSIAPVHFRIVRCHQIKKRHHLWLLLLKVFHRLAESSFPEVEMPTMGSLTVHCEAESYCVCVCVLRRVWLLATPWSPPGSPAHGIFQARMLEWVAISYPRRSSNPGIEPVFPANPLHCRWILYRFAPGAYI